jgi:hypothetical protein
MKRVGKSLLEDWGGTGQVGLELSQLPLIERAVGKPKYLPHPIPFGLAVQRTIQLHPLVDLPRNGLRPH